MAVTDARGSRRIAQGSLEVSPSETSQPLSKRVRIFEAIANLNRRFDEVLTDVKLLRELGLFQYKAPSPFAETCRLTLEELRGWANFELTGALYQSGENRTSRRQSTGKAARRDVAKRKLGSVWDESRSWYVPSGFQCCFQGK
jgi:hypothetical protein